MFGLTRARSVRAGPRLRSPELVPCAQAYVLAHPSSFRVRRHTFELTQARSVRAGLRLSSPELVLRLPEVVLCAQAYV
jgi:hypothetical protein